MYDALSEGKGSTQYKARMNGLAKIIIGGFYLFRNLVNFKTELMLYIQNTLRSVPLYSSACFTFQSRTRVTAEANDKKRTRATVGA